MVRSPILRGFSAAFAVALSMGTVGIIPSGLTPAASAATACDPATGNLILNGDFESPSISNPLTNNLWQVYGGASNPGFFNAQPSIPNWNPRTYQVELQRNGLFGTAAVGQQYAEIDSPGQVLLTQNVATVPGAVYELRFFYAARPDVAAQSMGAYWNGQLVKSISATGLSSGIVWTCHTVQVTAVSAQTVVGFGAIGGSAGAGNFIDYVSLVLVSSPSSSSSSSSSSLSSSSSSFAFMQCQDGADNDGDGKIDANDPGCYLNGTFNPTDNDETDPVSSSPSSSSLSSSSSVSSASSVSSSSSSLLGTCADGRDNENDTFIDAQDPDCHTDGNANNPNSYVQSRSETTFNLSSSSSSSSSRTHDDDDLKVGVEASADEVFPGGSFDCTITIENETGVDLKDLIVTATFDEDDVTVTDDGDADDEDDGELIFEIGDLDDGDDEEVEFRLKVDNSANPGTVVTCEAEVEASDGTSNDDEVDVRVIGTLPQTGAKHLSGGTANLTKIGSADTGGSLGAFLALAASGIGAGGFLGRKFFL